MDQNIPFDLFDNINLDNFKAIETVPYPKTNEVIGKTMLSN